MQSSTRKTIGAFIGLLNDVGEKDNDKWWGIVGRQAKYFDEEIICEALDQMATTIADTGRAPSNPPAYFRKVLTNISGLKRKKLIPISEMGTDIVWVDDKLDVDALRRKIVELDSGGTEEQRKYFSSKAIEKEAEFLKLVEQEWVEINDVIKCAPAILQTELWERYCRYREELGWNKKLKDHRQRISRAEKKKSGT